jgi:phosphoribosyl-ATP pyrophosphohydrolase
MALARQARLIYGNSFTYTLLESGDFIAADKVAGEAKKAAKAAKKK